MTSSYTNNTFKISTHTWNGKFELPDGSYSASDIQDYFEHILKTKRKKTKTKDKNDENAPHFEINEVAVVHHNIANNDYQQESRVLYTFVPNKPFGSLLEISPKNHIFLKTFNLELQAIELWFTYQNSQPLEIEDRINLTPVIK